MTALLLTMLAPQVALRAHYLDAGGGSHELKLWRDATHLRRDSDETLQIFVEAERYTVIDRTRGRLYRAERSSLHQIGSFPDYATLSSLGRPAPQATRLGSERTAVGSCRWFGDGAHRLCWSEKWQVALILAELQGDTWQEKLRVDAISSALPSGVFLPVTSGLQELDLDRDLGD